MSEIKFKNGDVYIGDVVKGKPHGDGTMTYNNEDKLVYEGEWKNGKREGKGVSLKKSDNSMYEGEFQNDKPNGLGLLYTEDQILYYRFKDGAPEELIDSRIYAGGRINLFLADRDYVDYETEDLPVVSTWFNKKGEIHHDLEGKWEEELLECLNNNFKGAIHRSDYLSFSMSESLQMSEDEFIDTFNDYLIENEIKAKIGRNLAGYTSIIFEPVKSGMQKLAEAEEQIE